MRLTIRSRGLITFRSKCIRKRCEPSNSITTFKIHKLVNLPNFTKKIKNKKNESTKSLKQTFWWLLRNHIGIFFSKKTQAFPLRLWLWSGLVLYIFRRRTVAAERDFFVATLLRLTSRECLGFPETLTFLTFFFEFLSFFFFDIAERVGFVAIEKQW